MLAPCLLQYWSSIMIFQNNHNTVSFDILHRCPVAPVPVFIQVQESLFGDINSTPKLLGLDSSSGDYHLHNTLNSQEITTTSLGWNGKHTLSDVDLVELNSGNDGLGHVNVGMRQVVSPNDSDTSKQKSFKMSTSVRLSDTSVLSNKDYTSEGKDNLRYFALNALSMNSDVPSGKISDSATEKCHMYKLGEICINTETNLDNSDWYCFNSADARDCVTKACVPDLSLDDREINGSSSTCVTIKKQNIETQEMIDLLHVRDDPTILSIYQSTTFQAQSSSKESPSRYIQDSHHSSTADQQLPQSVDIDDDAGFPVDWS
uniref:Uncharacterized protein n=1 Tax=Arion vulgaris TaxID=1028688 RepID=A0A0B7APM7_9EUPU